MSKYPDLACNPGPVLHSSGINTAPSACIVHILHSESSFYLFFSIPLILKNREWKNSSKAEPGYMAALTVHHFVNNDPRVGQSTI